VARGFSREAMLKEGFAMYGIKGIGARNRALDNQSTLGSVPLAEKHGVIRKIEIC